MNTGMAKFVIAVALCMLPAIVTAGSPFLIEGKVYCDTCRLGYETSATTYIEGAIVRVECRDRTDLELLYSSECTTDSSGKWEIQVDEDHQDQLCTAFLVSSPLGDCKTADPGRSRASLILTRYNGAISSRHCANNMGFLKDEALPVCAEILAKYQQLEIEE